MNFADPGDAEAYEAFIQQDDYLNDNRGKYADRYGALAPWRSRWDLRILQDINLGEKHTIQLSLDILNFGNLINSNWGVVQEPTFNQLLGVSVDENNVPTYNFDQDLNRTFTAATDARSRWQAQFGVRYIFN